MMVPISLILRSGLRTSEVPGSFRVLYWYREIHLGIYGLQIILLYSSISHLSLPFFFFFWLGRNPSAKKQYTVSFTTSWLSKILFHILKAVITHENIFFPP